MIALKSIAYLAAVFLVICANVGCEAGNGGTASISMTTGELSDALGYSEYIPIDPVPLSETVSYTKPDGTPTTQPWKDIPTAVIRTMLPNQESSLTTYKIDVNGSVKYLTGNTTGSAGTYRIVMDYTWSTVEDIIDPDSKVVIGEGRVGVGLRITAELVTREANLDTGSLIAVGLAAKSGFARGKLKVSALGIVSPAIINTFPSPSSINESSIQSALEALATIKSKIFDDQTKVIPQLIAIRVKSPALKNSPVANKLPGAKVT